MPAAETVRVMTAAIGLALTDVSVRARPATFYRRLLARHFERLGCGLHHVKGGDKVFYDLERS